MAVKRRAEFRFTCTITVENVAVLKFSAGTSLGIPSTKVSSHDVAHTPASRLIERFLLLVCALTHVVFDVFHLSSPSLRTQTRPAIEYVSGEKGLRPMSYFSVFCFVEYTLMHALKYSMVPGSSCGAEGMWRSSAVETQLLPRVVRSLSESVPCKLYFPLKDVFKNLPIWAAALAAGAPRVQLRTSYADWARYGVACLHPRWLDFRRVRL